ncbi:MAG: alpha/beta fold hydrolase [Acidimicrobiales bacterium]
MSPPRTLRLPATGGVELAVDLWDGEGPGMLLVHGLASNAGLWRGAAEELARLGVAAACVDQRGHGRSDKPDGGYDFATVCADLLEVLDGLRETQGVRDPGPWDRPVVAGQSWGGNVVLELAWRAPDRLAGVACVDGGTIELSARFPTWEACAEALAPPSLVGLPAERFEARVRGAHPDWPESGIEGVMANVEVLPDGTIRPWLTRERHMLILRSLWEHRPSLRYPEVTVPVLLIHAEGDDLSWTEAKRAGVASAVSSLARSESHWLRGDHDLHAQLPAEVARLLQEAVVGGFWS